MENKNKKVRNTRMNEYIAQMLPQEDKIFTALLSGITYPDVNYRIKRSKPNFNVLEYVINGEGYVIANGKKYRAETGDVYILKDGEDCEYYSSPENPWKKIWLNFYGTSVNSLISLYGLDDVTLIKNTDIYAEMLKILEICKSGEEVNSRTELVFHAVLRILHTKLSSSGEAVPKEAKAMKDFVNSHFGECITIQKLAGLIYRSEAQTIRIFKTAYGITPYEYIIGCRIKNAKLLLTNTNLYIKEIAERCGFSDEHYFSNIFKAKTGYSPKEYRNIRK